MFERRVTLLVGHFGSGKTEIALNGALDLAARGEHVSLADIDIVKPYFRSRSARALLEDAGVRLIAPTGDNAHADLPIIVPQVRSMLREPGGRVILDAGGDDTGARVLGSFADVLAAADADCLVVLNFRRPFTPDVTSAVDMVRQIEAVARFQATGLVSNTHLMAETTPEIVMEGYRLASETGRRLDLPVCAVTAQAAVIEGLEPHSVSCPLIAIRRIVVPPHEQTVQQRSAGPLFVLN